MIAFIHRMALGIAALMTGAGVALAQETGQPHNWQFGQQTPVTPIGEGIHSFHDFTLAIITAIVLFVLLLLIICVFRFSEKRNPVPSKTTHNTFIEVVWTVAPVLILVAIAIPSFRLLFAQYDISNPDLTIKATGHQWYWSYEYQGGPLVAQGAEVSFDSVMLKEAEIKDKAAQPRLLAVDNEVIVPVNKNVQVLVTAADVIHSFAMPAFGVKADGVPGRINQTWFRAEKEGVYYGQCSELCGRDHAFMPIAIRVVSEAEFATWLAEAKKKFAAVSSESRPMLAALTGSVK